MPGVEGEQPRWVVLHGDDEFSRGQHLALLRARLAHGDPAMVELNTTLVDGGRLTFGELRHACDSIPFLALNRIVIVHNLLTRLATGGKRGGDAAVDADPGWKRAFRDQLLDYLPKLPPTTRLFFVESEVLPASDPILKLAQAEEKERRAYARVFHLPKDSGLPDWIQQHARSLEGQISREAGDLLAALVGPDLRLLDMEIDKLLLYVNRQRPVSTDDVRSLVSRAREASIFDLVDCIGRRETDRALQVLHRLLEDEGEPLQILGMIGRQVRILIEVSELRGQGLASSEIAGQLKLHPFVVSKALDQVKNFQMSQLEAAHERLVETDWAIKTGRLDEPLALDLLVVNLGSRSS